MSLYGLVRNHPITAYDLLGKKMVPCSGCGPDVTDPLEKALGSIESGFHFEANYSQKRKACDNLYAIWRYALYRYLAWDIIDLYVAGADPTYWKWDTSCGAMRGGEGDCAGTVTYKGDCVYASAANYVMWGKMMSLCSNMPDDGDVPASFFSLNSATQMAHAWKNRAGDKRPDMHRQVEQFVKLGYSGSTPDFSKCGVEKCAASRCTVKGTFNWIWDPIPAHERK